MRKANYLIGWEGESQVVYGIEKKGSTCWWAVPMTRKQAEFRLKEFNVRTPRGSVAIFKLVPVKRKTRRTLK